MAEQEQGKGGRQASKESGQQPNEAPTKGGELLGALSGEPPSGKDIYEKAKQSILGHKEGSDTESGTEREQVSAADGQAKVKHPSARRKPKAKGQTDLSDGQKGLESKGDESDSGSDDEEPKKGERLSQGLARIAREESKARKRIEAQAAKLSEMQKQIESHYHGLSEFNKSIEALRSGDLENGLRGLSKFTGVDLSYQGLTQAALSGKISKHQAPEENEYIGVIQELNRKVQAMEQQLYEGQERTLSSDTEAYWAKASAVFHRDQNAHARFYEQQTGTSLRDMLATYVTNYVKAHGERPDPEQAAEAIENEVKSYHERVHGLLGKPQPPGQRRYAPPPQPSEEPFSLDGNSGAGGYDSQDALKNDVSDEAIRKRGLMAVRELIAKNQGV